MKTNYTLVLLLFIGLTTLCCSKESPKEFAQKLSNEICVLVNNGPTKVPAWGEDRVFTDPNFQLKLIQSTGGMSLKTPGKIEFTGYKSPVGKLNGELDWVINHILPAGASIWSREPWERADHHISGTLSGEDGEKLEIDILFSVKKGEGFPEEPYDINSIQFQGKIKVGDKDPVIF